MAMAIILVQGQGQITESLGTAKSPFIWQIPRRFSSGRSDFICKPLAVSSPSATPLIPAENDALYTYIRQPVIVTPEVDDGTKHRELLEKTRRELQRRTKPVETLKLIDNLQQLGIAYYFEDDINALLDRLSDGLPNEDLFTTALCFRLLRDNGYKTGSDVFLKFMEKNMKFKEHLAQDTIGLLSLYEASYMGANGEEILSEAKEFSEIHLRQSMPWLAPQLRRKVGSALELPRHLRMARLEARRYIEEYATESEHDPALLELARLDYNKVQLQHQMELAEITRWDLDELEILPPYMRICYMALYNTTNEICYKILKEYGFCVLPYLKSTVKPALGYN
ncbi:unnamed protein product [Fraxinus pennsylvanica]|uniref:Uncharacterized protein n=1 Tax=Fraxinus pennsylvanica TaxID=56036 RepID=A0AAD2EBV0_9LAMI|nr:unnamed protein product [Fraxinus pennsylvanica]